MKAEDRKVEFCIQDVEFSYEKKKILKGIRADFRGAGVYGIFGPNGSGKSTLLKCCSGILKPERGHILVQNQEHRLSFPFSVEEVVLMGRTPYLGGIRGPKGEDREMAWNAMEEIGIAELSDRPYTQLSGGQRQLVLMARALAQDTPVLILDEPTSALDFKNQLKVFEILRTLAAKGKLILACTHDPNHVKWFCDQVLILKEGEVMARGAVSDTLTQHCLESLYGQICQLQNDVIIPKRNACA